MHSLYEQLGGTEGIDTAVEIFYRKMLADEKVRRFFDDVDMDRQMAKQAAFLTLVTGGPARYTGRDMQAAHAQLLSKGLADCHVDCVIDHLGATLREFGVGEEQVRQVAALAESLRDAVLGRAKKNESQKEGRERCRSFAIETGR